MNNNQDASPKNHLDADQPIKSRNQDLLGRRLFAEAVARQVSRISANQGCTIAIAGEWGSGKTSILNMVEETLQEDGGDVVFLGFNPWLFGGTADLVTRFFGELSAQLGQDPSAIIKSVARGFMGIGQALAPMIPVPGTSTVANLAAEQIASWTAPPSLHNRRDELRDALSKSEARFVVFIDDIDRLEPSETRDFMRLVRLTSDLPNVVFLLAFDRLRVEKSLGTNATEGRQYLEKIVQDIYHLPMVSEASITAMLIDRLNEVLKGRDLRPIDDGAMASVLSEVIKPLLGNLRDVKRYLNSLPVTLDLVGSEVALADVLGLEAVRVLRPSIFDALKAHPKCLVHSDSVSLLSMSDTNRAETIKKELMEIMEQAGDERKVLESLLEILFPATNGYLGRMSHGPNFKSTWRAERRVACEEVLRIYLQGGLDEGALASRELDDIVEALTEEQRLAQLLDALNDQKLEEALKRLLDFYQAYPVEAVPVAVPVLVNIMGRLSDQSVGMSFVSPRMKASQIVYRLLEKKKDPEALRDSMSEILPKVDTLSGQFELVEMVGHREGVGHKLVSEGQAKELEEKLARLLESATTQQLVDEWDLFGLVYRTLNWMEGKDKDGLAAKLRKHLSEDRFVLTVLHTDKSSQSSNGHFEKLLAWDAYLEMFGEEFTDAVKRLARSPDFDQLSQDNKDAIGLALKYARGWRPERW